MTQPRFAVLSIALVIVAGSDARAQQARTTDQQRLTRSPATARQTLGPTDIAAITQLVMMEDTRRFDDTTLTALLQSKHPEVRRRALVTVGRIVDPRGRALLASARGDTNAEIVATVAFSTGQLKDADAVPWLGEVLASPKTPPAVAREAASALGKIRSPEARAALAAYLTGAPVTAASRPVVGEALLAFGRFMPPGAVTPIVRWVSSPDPEVRWRAAWALFRPRDPAGVPHLLRLADDKSADVRFWAVRGLAPAVVTAAGLDPARAAARLRHAVGDSDRRVRTEALRALAAYDDDESFGVVLAALESPDSWMSVSSAEALGRFTARKDVVVPKLVAAAAPSRPLSVRLTTLASLAALAPEQAIDVAAALAGETSVVARTTALQILRRLGGPGAARIEQLVTADASLKTLLPAQPAAPRPPRPTPAVRAEAEYRQLVERWIVPDYKGAAKPRAILETPRGAIELELYPGDAPLGLDYFVRLVESGAIVGTEFGRVVPNFVAQQRPIRDEGPLRDEVNGRGLTRGNLSWASAGLDTGRPGYTLGNTAQPHNEGDFTALGRVVRGMDVVDRLELGDRITAARMVSERAPAK